MIGQMLQGRFQIERVLGKGGFGTVYLARQHSAQPVAIKTLELGRIDPLEHRAAIEQFHAEGSLLAQLDHPGLVKVYGAFEERGQHFLVMDFVNGITLAQGVKRKKGYFTLDQFHPLAHQLCDVLQYLHSRNPAVIFRDLKPSNIMVTPKHEVKLIDFGIARFFTDESRTQTFIKGLGSAGYAPLEQYGAGTTDPRSDIYSLGATFYAFLTKEVPPAVVSIVAGVETLKPMSLFNPAIPNYLDAVVARMMSIRKEQRFDSIEALRPLLFSPPEDEEDPTGTLRLARKRQEASELGPCLVCRRVGPDPGPFSPPHCPLTQTKLEQGQPYTLVLGLKSEIDPQSGLHFQKGDKKKHAATKIELGFKGAAALVVCETTQAGLKGDHLLEQIQTELIEMAATLLDEMNDLDVQYRLAAAPILEELGRKLPSRKVEAQLAVFAAYQQSLPEESSLLQKQRERTARMLREEGRDSDAAPLLQKCLNWLQEECLKELRTKGFGEAAELQARWHNLFAEFDGPLQQGVDFLAGLSKAYQQQGRDAEAPYRVARLAAGSGQSKCRALAAFWAARHYLDVCRWEDAEQAALEALASAEERWGSDCPDLYPYVDVVAQAAEHLMRPERLELKSRALILKYKAKAPKTSC